MLLDEPDNSGDLAILETVVVANAYEGSRTVQVDDQFSSARGDMNVRGQMIVEVDHDLVAVYAKYGGHGDTRI